MIVAAYVVLAPFAAAFFFWAVKWAPAIKNRNGDLDPDELAMPVLAMLAWPVFVAIALVLLLIPKMHELEKKGERP